MAMENGPTTTTATAAINNRPKMAAAVNTVSYSSVCCRWRSRCCCCRRYVCNCSRPHTRLWTLWEKNSRFMAIPPFSSPTLPSFSSINRPCSCSGWRVATAVKCHKIAVKLHHTPFFLYSFYRTCFFLLVWWPTRNGTLRWMCRLCPFSPKLSSSPSFSRAHPTNIAFRFSSKTKLEKKNPALSRRNGCEHVNPLFLFEESVITHSVHSIRSRFVFKRKQNERS